MVVACQSATKTLKAVRNVEKAARPNLVVILRHHRVLKLGKLVHYFTDNDLTDWRSVFPEPIEQVLDAGNDS